MNARGTSIRTKRRRRIEHRPGLAMIPTHAADRDQTAAIVAIGEADKGLRL